MIHCAAIHCAVVDRCAAADRSVVADRCAVVDHFLVVDRYVVAVAVPGVQAARNAASAVQSVVRGEFHAAVPIEARSEALISVRIWAPIGVPSVVQI